MPRAGSTTKPFFLLSKGERNRQGGLFLDSLADHYRRIAGGCFKWEGTPDGMPQGYIEDTALFYCPAVGCKRVKALGTVILPCRPATLNVYGRPYSWIFSPQDGMTRLTVDSDLFEETNDPCLWMGSSIHEMIEPFLDIMKNTLATLNVNIDGLAQPIVASGVPGGELGTLVIKDAVLSKERVIPTTGTGFNVQVLDLKAQDHSQNLISVLDWCDARILEIMASSNGVEKASGITTMETVSGVQSIMQELQIGLEKRRAWADECNDRFKMDMTVDFGEGIKALTQRKQEAEDDGAEDRSA